MERYFSGLAVIDLPQKALRRRSQELAKAASEVSNENSRALLLFYSAECGLKAIYMAKNALKSTSASHSVKSASSFNHRIDDLIIALKVPSATVAPRPADLALKGTTTVVSVGELNQVWRYGGSLADQTTILIWLEAVVAYAKKELL